MTTATDHTPLDRLPPDFELIADPVLLVGDDIVDYNDAFVSLCEQTAEELSTMTAADLVSTADYDRLKTELAALRTASQKTATVTLNIKGVEASIEWSLSRVPDDRSSVPRVIAVGHPVSTDQSRPAAAERRTEALTAAHEIIADSSRQLDTKVDDVLELVRETLDTEFAMLSRIEDDQYSIEALTPSDDLGVSPGETMPIEWTNCEHVVTTEQTLVLNDIETSPFADKEANTRLELSSYLGTPVYADDGLYGTFCFYSREQPEDDFSDWEVTFVEFLSNWISYEIEREQLLDQIRKEERQRYETVVTQSSDGVVMVEDGVFSFVNERFVEITGYSREELLGMDFECVLSPESRDLVSRRHTKRILGESPPSTYEIGVESKTGEQLELELAVSRIEQDGEPAVLANVRDISKRRHHQRAVSILQASTDRMQQADDAETVAQIAVDAASDALDLPYATCWFHDPETDKLEPVAATEPVKQQDRLAAFDTSRYEYGVFRHGNVAEYTPAAVEAEASFETGVLLPLGDHGLLAVGHRKSTDRDGLLIDVARTLADHTTIALNRIERTEQIRKNERRFRAIFNQTYQFTGLLEPDGTVIEANDTALEFGGLEASDVLGTPLWNVDWFSRASLQETVRTAVDRAAAGEFVREELHVQGADRRAVVDFSLRPVTDEAGTVQLLIPEGRDITELKARETELKRERDHVRQTERLAAVGGWELDSETGALAVTNGTRELFGFDESTAITAPEALEYIHTDDRERLLAAVRSCQSTGEPMDLEVETSTAVSQTQWLQLTGERVDDTTVRGALRDISNRKERRQRLTVLNRVLRHNLRNRLTVVTAHANELESKLADSDGLVDPQAFSVETARSQVKTIQQSTRELLAVAEKVRAFEKAATRLEELRPVPLNRVLSSLREEYEQKHPTVKIDAERTDQRVVGDEEILRLAIEELLTNAIKHSDQPTPQITISVDDDRDTERITITDNGPGIPKQERDVLQSGTETPLEHGSGIGLWTVQWLISRIGGHMEIDDNTPRGTTVSLAMPRDQPA